MCVFSERGKGRQYHCSTALPSLLLPCPNPFPPIRNQAYSSLPFSTHTACCSVQQFPPPSLPFLLLMGEAVHSSHAPSCLNKNEFADRLSAYVSLSTSLPPPSPSLMPPLSASPHASHTLFLNPSLQETPRVRF